MHLFLCNNVQSIGVLFYFHCSVHKQNSIRSAQALLVSPDQAFVAWIELEHALLQLPVQPALLVRNDTKLPQRAPVRVGVGGDGVDEDSARRAGRLAASGGFSGSAQIRRLEVLPRNK